MISLQCILLPTDFSNTSQSAIEMACLLAERFDAQLHLLHVMDDLADRLPDFALGLDLQSLHDALKKKYDEWEIEILAKLSQVLEPQWKHGKRTTIATRRGPAFVKILEYAREHDVELIVMGTHGRSGITHAMLGSVAERVVRLAACPVLTVRPKE